MIKLLAYPIRLFLFWLLLFTAFQLLLICSEISGSNFSFAEVFTSFVAAFPLNVSAICYLTVIPLLLFISYQFLTKNIIANIVHTINYLLIVIVIPVLFFNIVLMKQWGTVINFRAISYLTDFRTALASVTNFQMITGTVFMLLLILAVVFGYNKIIKHCFLRSAIKNISKILLSLLLIVLTGTFTRGGFQQIPINESAVYFSSKHKLNLIATNPLWHLLHSILQAGKTEGNPYFFYDEKLATQLTNDLITPSDSVAKIFSASKPNVVLILLESFTADVIQELGGDRNVTPNISKLIKDGLLFTNIYSSGARTDVALPSIISGFPALPYHSIIRYPDKSVKLPSILSPFNKDNYQTSFYYGGDLNFSNMLSFLTIAGFDNIIGKEKFDSKQFNSKWGAQDEFLFSKHLTDMDTVTQPFFSMLLTLSSHEPYESPMQSPFKPDTDPGLFKNVAWYTDYCLGNYFKQAQTKEWFNNTIFILVADHGNRLVRNRGFFDIGIRHVPLIILGKPLKLEYHGQKISATGNHHDIAATLLTQLNYPATQFQFSNNLLNQQRKNFAYLNMDNSAGWITDSCSFVFDTEQNKFLFKATDKCNADTVHAKAYMQEAYRLFLEY